MFRGRLNVRFVELGMAAGPVLFMLNALWLQAAAEGRGLHSHHSVFLPFPLLWLSNRETTVLSTLEGLPGPVALCLFILVCLVSDHS